MEIFCFYVDYKPILLYLGFDSKKLTPSINPLVPKVVVFFEKNSAAFCKEHRPGSGEKLIVDSCASKEQIRKILLRFFDETLFNNE